MFDMHYDLLSVAYCCYLKKDYSYLEEWCKAYRDNNVRGVVCNLYFSSNSNYIQDKFLTHIIIHNNVLILRIKKLRLIHK